MVDGQLSCRAGGGGAAVARNPKSSLNVPPDASGIVTTSVIEIGLDLPGMTSNIRMVVGADGEATVATGVFMPNGTFPVSK